MLAKAQYSRALQTLRPCIWLLWCPTQNGGASSLSAFRVGSHTTSAAACSSAPTLNERHSVTSARSHVCGPCRCSNLARKSESAGHLMQATWRLPFHILVLSPALQPHSEINRLLTVSGFCKSRSLV